MAEETVLDMLRLQRLSEQGVRAKINHARRQIIASSPVCVDLPQLFGPKGSQNLSGASHQMFSGNSEFGHRKAMLILYSLEPWDAEGFTVHHLI
jgi:hypothetical protein